MRVIINPGTYREAEEELRDMLQVNKGLYIDPWDYVDAVAEQNAALIEMLVEKGALTLADCQALGAPHMEKVK